MAAPSALPVRLITGLPEGYDRSLFDEMCLDARPWPNPAATRTSTTLRGNRQQLLLSPGESLTLSSNLFEGADAFVLAPAYHEFDGLPANLRSERGKPAGAAEARRCDRAR